MFVNDNGYNYRHILVIHYDDCDLRAKLLVACKVTPAIWLNLSDSRNTFWTIIKGTYPRFNWT